MGELDCYHDHCGRGPTTVSVDLEVGELDCYHDHCGRGPTTVSVDLEVGELDCYHDHCGRGPTTVSVDMEVGEECKVRIHVICSSMAHLGTSTRFLFFCFISSKHLLGTIRSVRVT